MLFHEFRLTRSTYICDKRRYSIHAFGYSQNKIIKIAFNKDPISGWKNLDPKSVFSENLRILILPILQDLNADLDKWTLNFVEPINKPIQDSIDTLISIHDNQKQKLLSKSGSHNGFKK